MVHGGGLWVENVEICEIYIMGKLMKGWKWDQLGFVISPKGKANRGHMFCHIHKPQRAQLHRFCHKNLIFLKIQ